MVGESEDVSLAMVSASEDKELSMDSRCPENREG
jgi:hypothetical protein